MLWVFSFSLFFPVVTANADFLSDGYAQTLVAGQQMSAKTLIEGAGKRCKSQQINRKHQERFCSASRCSIYKGLHSAGNDRQHNKNLFSILVIIL
jgi:hypothetical protein